MRLITFILLTFVFLTPLPIAAQTCDDLASRFQIGMLGQVTPGSANNVRNAPHADAELAGQLAGGSTFLVTDDPICADGLMWLPVTNAQLGISGYTVEGMADDYWTEPLSLEGMLENLAFDFTAVADDVTLEIIPASDNFDSFFGGNPEYIQIMLESPIAEEFLTSEIRIYPIQAFEAINPEFHDLMRYGVDDFSDAELPTPLPKYLGAGLLHMSHVERLEFDLAVGVRYIAQYGQYAAPINSFELFYTFQGITRDEQYWIYALLPLRAPTLDIFYDDNADQFRGEIGVNIEGNRQLNEFASNMSNDVFFPTLSTLDNVITSLNFYGSDGRPSPVITRLPENFAIDLSGVSDSGYVIEDRDDELGRLTLYLAENESWMPGSVYIINQKAMTNFSYAETMFWLRAFLEQSPATFETIKDYYGATRPVLGGIQYFETDVLKGVLYIPAPRGVPVTSSHLTYAFHGFTKDDQYYVYGEYLIESDLLPATASDMSQEERDLAISDDEEIYNAYIEDIRTILTHATPEDFHPSLDVIEAIFASLTLATD